MSVHRRLTILFAAAMVALGFAMIGVTLANGGGEAGLLLGALFVVAGAARLYLQRAR